MNSASFSLCDDMNLITNERACRARLRDIRRDRGDPEGAPEKTLGVREAERCRFSRSGPVRYAACRLPAACLPRSAKNWLRSVIYVGAAARSSHVLASNP